LEAAGLLEGQKAQAVLADKGYDSDVIVGFIRRTLRAKAVIPPRRNRKVQRRYGKQLYRQRNIIERAFNQLKQWRRVATRYDRCDATFAATLILAAIQIWA
jgi:transposase